MFDFKDINIVLDNFKIGGGVKLKEIKDLLKKARVEDRDFNRIITILLKLKLDCDEADEDESEDESGWKSA